MVTVDFWDMVADIMGLLLGLKLESMKKDWIKNRTEENEIQNRVSVLLADIIGGCVSFALLFFVVIAGTLMSADSIANPTADPVQNRKWMLFYAVFNFFADFFPLGYLYFTTTTKLESNEDSNKLNIVSGLLHVSIDLLRAFVTMMTTTYLLIANQTVAFNGVVDGYGSLVICVVVLASAFWVAHEA